METHQTSQGRSGSSGLAKVVLDVPTLWADHHVLKVREALLSLEGVQSVYASSAWKQVLVQYDEAKVERSAIERRLAEAGYPVAVGQPPMVVLPTPRRRDPQWAQLNVRTTQTNRTDIDMSGEFRRY